LLDFCRAKQCPIVVSIPCPVGRWSNNFSECLDDSDREYFTSLQREYPFLRRDFDSNYFRRGCSAGTEKLYLTPYGDIIPCPFIHISFGNVKEEPCSVIRTRMLKLDRFRDYCQVCLAGEDPVFIDTFIRPTYGTQHLPMSWKDHPVLSEKLR
jgi:MoaA/NifB/PqqE/SkfB family radical SAM enzyme